MENIKNEARDLANAEIIHGIEVATLQRVVITPLISMESNVGHINNVLAMVRGFRSYGGTLCFEVAGSGWSSGFGLLGMDVFVDGNLIAKCRVFVNHGSTHQAFVPATFEMRGVPAGNHYLELRSRPSTRCDENDYFNVRIVEYI